MGCWARFRSSQDREQVFEIEAAVGYVIDVGFPQQLRVEPRFLKEFKGRMGGNSMAIQIEKRIVPRFVGPREHHHRVFIRRERELPFPSPSLDFV